jgi:universal stress protein A
MKAKPTNQPGAVTLELGPRDEPLLAAAAQAAAKSPFKIDRILVPIDFSECSKKALRYALPLARQHGAALTLLHIVPPAYGGGEYAGFNFAELEANMQAAGEKDLAQLARDEVPAEIPAETLVRIGHPGQEVVGLARSLLADLIVISTHGRTGLKHIFLGSVAEYVVRHAPCPVFVVREREHEILAS